MGILGVGLKFAGRVFGKGGYARRAVKVFPETVFGTGQEAMAGAFKGAMRHNVNGKSVLKTGNIFKKDFWKNLGTGFKNAGKAAEKHSARQIAQHGSFWKATKASLKDFFPSLGRAWKAGGTAAKAAGKSGLLGSIKGLFKGIGKKMPLIGSALLVAFELPNIIKATKNEGIAQGACEAGKACARLGGGALGGAIGAAVLGPIGGILGWCVGEWLTGKVVGKSYSERKAEEEQKQAELVQQVQQGYNPYEVQSQAGVQDATYVSPQATGAYNTPNPVYNNPCMTYPNMTSFMGDSFSNGSSMSDDFMFNAWKKSQNQQGMYNQQMPYNQQAQTPTQRPLQGQDIGNPYKINYNC